MQVRRATKDDNLDFAILSKKFLKESKYPFKLNSDKLLNSFEIAVQQKEFLVLVLEDEGDVVGMLVGGYTEPLFSDDRVATELAWFVEPDYRKKRHSLELVSEYEKWAEDSGCTFVTMMDIHGLNDLTSLYERKGYTLTEKTFVRKI